MRARIAELKAENTILEQDVKDKEKELRNCFTSKTIIPELWVHFRKEKDAKLSKIM